MKEELMSDCLRNVFQNETNLEKTRYIIEKCYSRYESRNETYLIKNRLHAFSRLKKYPRVIVIDRGSNNWWAIPEII